MTAADLLDAQRRIRVDYDEWPMLKLTFPQAARLWSLPHDICQAAMANLVHAEYLQRRNGVYLRRTLGLGGRRAGVRPPAARQRQAA
jgi:hypothetical protein